MASSSVSQSCNPELPLGNAAAAAALPPHPVLLPISQNNTVGPETLEQSFASLDLDPLSDLRTTSPTKKNKGPVRLRLARFGRKNAPFYRIHAADSRCPRDGKFLERIGYYDPRPGKDGQKRIALNFERAKYWLSVGAQPSDTVRRLLCIAGLLPKPPVPQVPKKGTYSPKNSKDVGTNAVFDEEFNPEAGLEDFSEEVAA